MAIIWTNADQNHWCIYVALVLNEFKDMNISVMWIEPKQLLFNQNTAIQIPNTLRDTK